MKIIVGAGDTTEDGWLSLNESDLDVTDAAQWAAMFPPNSLDAILAEHVWEHLNWHEARAATRNAAQYLKPGGVLRIAVPDGRHADTRYVAWVMPSTGYNGDDHKLLFDYQSLARLMRASGLRPVLREWWDETGTLHTNLYSDEDGKIKRCVGGAGFLGLTFLLGCPYTSLVVDGVK